MHSLPQLFERARRWRWFPCVALIAVAGTQIALAIFFIPNGFGSAPARGTSHSEFAEKTVAEQIPTRAVAHDVQRVATIASAQRHRIVPMLDSNAPAPETTTSPTPEPSVVASPQIRYAPAPSTSGRRDASAPPASSAAFLAEHPMPAPVPSSADSIAPPALPNPASRTD